MLIFTIFFPCQTDELNVHFRLPAPICNSIFHFGSKSSGPTKLSTTVSLFICKLPLTAEVNGFHHIHSNQTLSFRTRGKRYPSLGINRFEMTARHLYWQSSHRKSQTSQSQVHILLPSTDRPVVGKVPIEKARLITVFFQSLSKATSGQHLKGCGAVVWRFRHRMISMA